MGGSKSGLAFVDTVIWETDQLCTKASVASWDGKQVATACGELQTPSMQLGLAHQHSCRPSSFSSHRELAQTSELQTRVISQTGCDLLCIPVLLYAYLSAKHSRAHERK